MRRFVPSLLAAMLLAGAALPVAQADPTIPVADFYKRPAYDGIPVMSPDGTHIAVLTPRNGRAVLAVIDLDTRKATVVAADPEWDVTQPVWINNNRLLFRNTKGSSATYEEQTGGGMFAVNRDGSGFRKLMASVKDGDNAPKKRFQLLRTASDGSNDVFVLSNDRGRDADIAATDVLRLDTTTGRTTLLTFDNPGNVLGWAFDNANVIRAAMAMEVEPGTKRVRGVVYYRDNEKSPWKKIHTGYPSEGNTMEVLGFDTDDKTMIVAGRFNGNDRVAVHVWDFAKGTAGEAIADHPLVDVTGNLVIDRVRKSLVGVAFESMKPEMYFFDEEYARVEAAMRASFPNQYVNIQLRGKRAIVTVYSETNLGKVYLYDTEKKALEFIYTRKPELEDRKLSPTTAIAYKARDGLSIPAYLTLPAGVEPKGLPLLVYVHGGPHARDSWGYNPLLQLLASRGYAVLQPQFRMSTGFGWKHHTAGWKQWGLAMQDDLTDGVHELVKRGIVDANRVCIMGASYGGYATMYGLVKDPDLYKCGINWVGVTDVKMLFTVAWSDTRGPVFDDMATKMHGDPKTDEEYFRKVSAIDNADRIKAPVMMAYGSEDIRVPLIHGEKMRDKLRARGVPVEWLVMVGEGHGWNKESNNIMFGEKVLDFVNRYIGPASAAAKK